MDKEEICALLSRRGVAFERVDHPAVYTMEEADRLALPYPLAKNLLVRDDKKAHYYLITVPESQWVNLKEFAARYQTRRLSFASPADLSALLGLTPGSVSPLGLLHDAEHRAAWYVEEELFAPPGRIGVHPCDNTATLWLSTEDLAALLQEHGCEVVRAKL